jgi:hypothetical protein
LSASGVMALIRFAEAAENVAVSVSSLASITRPVSGTAKNSLSASMSAKVLGEDWADVAAGAEVWSDVALGSQVWTDVSLGNEVWARQ